MTAIAAKGDKIKLDVVFYLKVPLILDTISMNYNCENVSTVIDSVQN